MLLYFYRSISDGVHYSGVGHESARKARCMVSEDGVYAIEVLAELG